MIWPQKHETLGIGVSATTYAELAEVLVEAAQRRQPAIVDFTPASVLTEAARDPVLRAKLNTFDVVCPDGQPVRWALNYFHNAGLRETVSGTPATLHLCESAARHGIGIYLYGATHATLQLVQENLLRRFPALRIAGMESPPFRPPTPLELQETVRRMNTSGAGFVFVGIGSPKQEHFVWNLRHRVDGVQLCVGAAFDFIAGTKQRAPAWMQRSGLEWLHRLCHEPRRLGRRYFSGNYRFALLVAAALFRRVDRPARA